MKLAQYGLILALLLSLSCNQPRYPETAPEFNLPELKLSGENVLLSQLFKDSPVLLVFWATWCPTCVEEIGTLNQWSEQYRDQGLKILAVNVEETRAQVLEFEKLHPMKYPVVLDEKGTVAELYDIRALPVAVFLAKGGKILYYGFGLPAHLDQLLAAS